MKRHHHLMIYVAVSFVVTMLCLAAVMRKKVAQQMEQPYRIRFQHSTDTTWEAAVPEYREEDGWIIFHWDGAEFRIPITSVFRIEQHEDRPQ